MYFDVSINPGLARAGFCAMAFTGKLFLDSKEAFSVSANNVTHARPHLLHDVQRIALRARNF